MVTAKNEEADIIKFLRSIEWQTRRPDLFVLTVEDSTDRTAVIAEEFAELMAAKFKTTVIRTKGANRSVGRNIAAAEATRQGVEILAFTNVSMPEPMWLETLVKPIEDFVGHAYASPRPLDTPPYVEMTGGSWFVAAHSDREAAMGLLTQFSPDQLDVTKISALNMAITVEAFERIGGFNPTLDTSEDTDFMLEAEMLFVKSVFVPTAEVRWRPSTLTLRGALKTYYQFAKTDAMGILRTDQYVLTYLAYLMFPLLPFWLLGRIRKVIKARLLRQIPLALVAAIGLDIARMVGYAKGRLHANSRRS